MSSIQNIISTTFRAVGGNVVAELNNMSGGARTFLRNLDQNSRMSERLNNQWRAIGTTIRYAFAGTAVFGAARLIGQLKDINVQLGQMQALSGIGGTAFSNRQVDTLGDRLQRVAMDTITPLNDVNDAAVNFLSTVQNVDPSKMPAMLTEIGQAAKIAQTPFEDLTQAATTFQIAFGRAVDPKSLGQFTRMWQQLIGVAPGGIAAAPTIAQAIPGLASMFELAPGRNVRPAVAQAQLMSLTLGSLRTGMPPATAMRGLTYFLQSIAQPTGGARKALAGIGITPRTVEQQGIYSNAMKLLRTISARPGTAKRLGAMTDDSLDALDESGGNLPGIPAEEMTRLRKMIPRIHGIRAAIILASQLQPRGDVQSLGGDLNMMLSAQNENSDTTRDLRKAWQNLSRRSRMQAAVNDVNLMGIQIAQSFNPLFDWAAGGIHNNIAPWMQDHRSLVKKLAVGGASFAGALTLGNLLGVGRLPGLRNIPGLRSLTGGRAFVAQTALAAAVGGGGGVLGGSPQHPMFVIVVGEVFGTAVTGGPAGGGGGGNGPIAVPWYKRGGAWIANKGSKAVAAAELAARAAPGFLLAEAPAAPDIWDMLNKGVDPTTGQKTNKRWWDWINPAAGDFKNATEYQDALKRAQKLQAGTTNISEFHKGDFKGRADVFMTLDITDPTTGKKTQKKIHVPVDMWKDKRVPRTQGKAGKGTR